MRPKVSAVTFLSGQHPFLNQILQADEIRIPGKGGKGLVGGIAIACWTQGKDLPAGLAGLFQLVHEFVGFL